MRQILIFDTTLRDGVKSPGTILTIEEKIRIAGQLGRLRVDVLEAGFPAASEEHYEVAQRIAGEVSGPAMRRSKRSWRLWPRVPLGSTPGRASGWIRSIPRAAW